MKITEKLEQAAGILLTVHDETRYNMRPICKLLKQAHDHILELEAENKRLKDAAN